MTPVPAVAILEVRTEPGSGIMPLTEEDERQFIAHLESLGPEQVKLMLPHGKFVPAFEGIALKWLAAKDREADIRTEASQSEQIEIARRASATAERAADAAERASAAAERQAVAAERAATEAVRANKRATIALVIAVISIIATAAMTTIGIWITHSDAH
jgi:hypothetical protein